MQSNERLDKLQGMLAKTPDDPFLIYAMGMEQKKSDATEAVATFSRVIQLDPNYCYAYFQKGQTLELQGDVTEAKRAYAEGIAAAQRVGDAHAQSELLGAMELLELE